MIWIALPLVDTTTRILVQFLVEDPVDVTVSQGIPGKNQRKKLLTYAECL